MSGPLFVQVDWNRDGSFTSTPYDDVTDRVRDGISASFGRDQSTSLQPTVGGRGTITLDNSDRLYSPRNTASGLYGNIKPARPVRITRTVGATTYTIFYGHTDDSPVDPDVDNRRVTLNLVDTLSDFRGVKVTTSLYQGIQSGAAISAVLDAAGWTGGRDLDTGSSTFPMFWANGDDAFSILQEILASEGPPALLTIDTTGAVVFRDRNHRLIRSRSLTSQATFRGGERDPEPVMARGFTYTEAWSNIINSVEFTLGERASGGDSLAQIWQTDDIINIPASQSITLVVSTSDPFIGAVTPVEDMDFVTVTGAVLSTTLSRTSGSSTSITYTATGLATSISGVQLRGYTLPVSRSYQITATDSASITDYGQKGLPSGLEPVWASRQDGQAIIDALVLKRKQPLPIVQAKFICSDLQTTRLAAILKLDLSDRVTVIEPETQLSNDFFIESITHDIDGQHQHVVTFGLEMVPATPTSVFILGTSTLNSATPLGY